MVGFGELMQDQVIQYILSPKYFNGGECEGLRNNDSGNGD